MLDFKHLRPVVDKMYAQSFESAEHFLQRMIDLIRIDEIGDYPFGLEIDVTCLCDDEYSLANTEMVHADFFLNTLEFDLQFDLPGKITIGLGLKNKNQSSFLTLFQNVLCKNGFSQDPDYPACWVRNIYL